MQEEWVVCKIFNKSIALGKDSHNMNSNTYQIDDPNMVSTNFSAVTPVPDLPSLLPPAQDGANMGQMHHQQQLVQDAAHWYNNASSPQLYDNKFNSSGAMLDVNSLWSF